jgi:hypothetical protein
MLNPFFDTTITKDDDVANDFDDSEECIAAALHHYKNGSFPLSNYKSKKSVKKEKSFFYDDFNFAVKEKRF